MVERFIRRVLLAVTCCAVLVLLPVSNAWAQKDIIEGTKHGVQKGAEGVKKGAEYAGEKTKEGATAVGKGAKDLVTDDDKNKNTNQTTGERMKPGETQSGSTSSGTTPSKTETKGKTSSSAKARLPRTAGNLPLLALIGVTALMSAAALKMVQKTPKRN